MRKNGNKSSWKMAPEQAEAIFLLPSVEALAFSLKHVRG
jgi:hypothetical protein